MYATLPLDEPSRDPARKRVVAAISSVALISAFALILTYARRVHVLAVWDPITSEVSFVPTRLNAKSSAPSATAPSVIRSSREVETRTKAGSVIHERRPDTRNRRGALFGLAGLPAVAFAAPRKGRAAGCLSPEEFVSKERNVDGFGSKVAIVTGANTGIGKQSVEQLNRLGFGTVVMAVRDVGKGEAAREDILARHPEINPESIVVRKLDLADLGSVREFARGVQTEMPRIDVLMNNAGVMASPEMTTKDGFELQFGTNHLGHFLLTNLLLDRLIQTGSKGDGKARIVNVASTAHLFGTMHFDQDLNLRGKDYDPWVAYGQSKLANILFTRELADRLKANSAPVTVNVLHPGVVSTDLQRYLLPEKEGPLRDFLIRIKESILTPEDKGAATQVYLSASKGLDEVSGQYFDNCQAGFLSPEAQRKDEAVRLWDDSVKLVGLKQ